MGVRLPPRCWSILQVVIIVTCHRWKVYGGMVQACVGQLSVSCPEMKIIQIKDVVLGESDCYWSCCIKDSDCTRKANENHITDVHRKCDNKQNCAVKVLKEKIPCGRVTWYNDFERITYDCMNDTRNGTTNRPNSTYEGSTEDVIDLKPARAEGCVGSQLSLSCPETKAIEVIDVVIGASFGTETTCNITDNNCTRRASENHIMEVLHRCDGRSNCVVIVRQEEVHCEVLDLLPHKGFESIAYYCLNGSGNYMTSTDGRLSTSSNNTKAEPVPNESISQVAIVVLAIICPIILLAIILLAVVMYRRKKGAQVKTRLDPVAMTEIDNNCQNEYDVCANETQGTSLHGDNDAQPMYSLIHEESDSPKRGENQIIYSEVELRETIWKHGQTTGETKAAAVESSTQLEKRTVSKAPSPQDDGCQMVIENDLYGMADNYARDTTVESPTRSLAGTASKTPSSQDNEGLTVIENDLYCH